MVQGLKIKTIYKHFFYSQVFCFCRCEQTTYKTKGKLYNSKEK